MRQIETMYDVVAMSDGPDVSSNISGLHGRCVSKNDGSCGYTVRDEFISVDSLSYPCDDMGRDVPISVTEEGCQTRIKTKTGVWPVTNNVENRPIRWRSGGAVILMTPDHMGCRVETCMAKGGEPSSSVRHWQAL